MVRKPLNFWSKWVKVHRPRRVANIATLKVYNISLDVRYKRPKILAKNPAFGATRFVHISEYDIYTGICVFYSNLGKRYECHISEMRPATDEWVLNTNPKIGQNVLIEG